MQAHVEPEGDSERLLSFAQRRVQESGVEDGQRPVQQPDESLNGNGEDCDGRLEPREERQREDVVEEREKEGEPRDC